MEPAPLIWLESLKPKSIDSWADLTKAFTNNFAGSMARPGNKIDLRQIKQKEGETLRDYLRWFFEKKATIVDISEADVIECLQNGLYDRRTYQDFGHRRPADVKELKVMVQQWADAEDKKQERFGSHHNRGRDNNHNNEIERTRHNDARSTLR